LEKKRLLIIGRGNLAHKFNKLEVMKMENKKVIIKTDYIGDAGSIMEMETCLFTNIVEQELKLLSPCHYSQILNHIAVEWDLNCRFSEIAFFGRSKDIDIAQNILINSVKYN